MPARQHCIRPYRRFLPLLLVVLGLALIVLSAVMPSPEREARAQPITEDMLPASGAPRGLVIDIQGVIGPPSTRLLKAALDDAAQTGARLVVFRLDTPGGLVTSTRDMIRDIVASQVPVIGYVAPAGGRAASAGTYLIYATNIAAMAPGTNIGAATPVQMGGVPGMPGQDPQDRRDGQDRRNGNEGGDKDDKNRPSDDTSQRETPAAPQDAGTRKALNDAIAFIRSLAELRGRNAEWAEKAVREADSISAAEALELGVIEVIATDLNDLMAQIDGRSINIGGLERTLSTQDIQLETYEPGWLTKALSQLANPNIAFILMLVGIYGLIFEFANPGTIGSGVIGVICLVLGLYSLNQLPLDYAGLILVLLGLAFMIGEAFTPSFGILGLGGLVAFVIGALFLIDTDVPEYQISWSVIAATALMSGLVLSVALGYAWRSQRRVTVTGMDQFIGKEARVIDWSGTSGHLMINGERWNARGPISPQPGDIVVIDAVDGLTFSVRAREIR
jgi:membrane-bound serine protease (ClpP class)